MTLEAISKRLDLFPEYLKFFIQEKKYGETKGKNHSSAFINSPINWRNPAAYRRMDHYLRPQVWIISGCFAICLNIYLIINEMNKLPIQVRFWFKNEYVVAFICDKYPGYSLTEDGRVFSHRKGLPIRKGIRATTINYKEGRIRRIQKNPKGYPIVGLCFFGKHITICIHTWMAYLFYGNRPEEMIIRHLDGNKLNSHYTNLRYGTIQENADDRAAHGSYFNGELHVNSKLTNEQAAEIRKLRLLKTPIKELSKKYNVGECTITDILQNKSYKCDSKTNIRRGNYK